jgi:hypothetical protein
MTSKVKNVRTKLSHGLNTTPGNHHSIETRNIGCQVKTPKTQMMAPNVVHQSEITQRIIKSPSGYK